MSVATVPHNAVRPLTSPAATMPAATTTATTMAQASVAVARQVSDKHTSLLNRLVPIIAGGANFFLAKATLASEIGRDLTHDVRILNPSHLFDLLIKMPKGMRLGNSQYWPTCLSAIQAAGNGDDRFGKISTVLKYIPERFSKESLATSVQSLLDVQKITSWATPATLVQQIADSCYAAYQEVAFAPTELCALFLIPTAVDALTNPILFPQGGKRPLFTELGMEAIQTTLEALAVSYFGSLTIPASLGISCVHWFSKKMVHMLLTSSCTGVQQA